MADQPNNNAGGNPGANNNNNNSNRRNNNQRRRHHNNRPRDGAPREGAPAQQGAGQPQQRNPGNQQPRPQGTQQQSGGQQQQRRRPPQHNNNRPRPQNSGTQQNPQGGGAFNIERVYEKYLNLLDQHVIARRKYHDLFYRADPAQKNKLERNFYNTLNDLRDFESKIAPDVKILFEKRNNGYQYDRTYTSNHEIPIEGDVVPEGLPPAEPHLLQSQIAADYSNDTEESVGTAEDYLSYKNF